MWAPACDIAEEGRRSIVGRLLPESAALTWRSEMIRCKWCDRWCPFEVLGVAYDRDEITGRSFIPYRVRVNCPLHDEFFGWLKLQ
jgi:hypothetical protein